MGQKAWAVDSQWAPVLRRWDPVVIEPLWASTALPLPRQTGQTPSCWQVAPLCITVELDPDSPALWCRSLPWPSGRWRCSGRGAPCPGAGEGRGGASAECTRPPLSLPSVTSRAGVGAGVWYEGCCSVVQRLISEREKRVLRGAAGVPGRGASWPSSPLCAVPLLTLGPWCRSHLPSVAAWGGRTLSATNLSP